VDLDIVVGADAIAVGERRRDDAVRLIGANAEIDRGGRVPDADVGRVGRGTLIEWLVERKPREQRGTLPGGLVEPAIDDDVGFEARRSDGDLTGKSVMDERRGGRELKRGKEGENVWWGWVEGGC
jgi:hypothetical protein